MKKLEVGDTVNVRDGSWCIRLDKYVERYHPSRHIGKSQDDFTVLEIDMLDGYGFIRGCRSEYNVHDIVIKNNNNGNVYLHSSSQVTKKIKPKKIVIDGKEIELSEESYNNLKESLLNQ